MMTEIVIDGIDIPPYAQRGIKQSYRHLRQAVQVERTCNGDLKDISSPLFRKIQTTVTCEDQQNPGLNGVWPGLVVTVDCLFTLNYRTIGGAPAYPVVPGSSYEDGDFTIYRPRIVMMVLDYDVDHDQWGAEIGWTLTMEEV